jgi:predicted transcriptional regulator
MPRIKLDRYGRSSLNGFVESSQKTLDVLFPGSRARLLRVLFALPPRQRYVRELSAISELALSTVQYELRKLSAMGLVTSWSNGYHRFYRANHAHPLVPHLFRVIEIAARTRMDTSGLKRRRSHSKKKRRQHQRLPVRSGPPSWGLFRATSKR